MTTHQYDPIPPSPAPKVKKMKIISSSTGTARKNSTTAQHGQRSQAWSDSLPTPNTHAEHDREDDREERHLEGLEQAVDQERRM